MGIAFIAAKAEKFGHQREEAFENQLKEENLFSSLPESVTQVFRCTSVPDAPLAIGIRVMLLRVPGEVQVFYLNRRIGTVMHPDAAELDVIMLGKKSPIRSARIVEVQHLSQTFSVQLTVRKSSS